MNITILPLLLKMKIAKKKKNCKVHLGCKHKKTRALMKKDANKGKKLQIC